MFRSATSFDGDISKWDVAGVNNMDNMFRDAVSFKRDLCGAAWVHSKASNSLMLEGSSGSITRAECTPNPTAPTNQVTHQYVSRRPMPERELIVRTPTSISTATIDRARTCPRCGTFRISGRTSCCAPGGAWFKDCGGLGSKNVDHMWVEGLNACKRKFKVNIISLHD